MPRLLALLAFVPAFLAGLTCHAQQVSPPAPIRYQYGDNPEWANPGFDDSAWTIAENGQWLMPPFYSDGFVWVRFRVPVRSDAAGPLAVRSTREFFWKGLFVSLADELYVDGALVGRQGNVPPHPRLDTYQRDAVFDLPAAAASPGRTAVVALRVWYPPYLRVPGNSGAIRISLDESRNLLLAQRAGRAADLYANVLDLALNIGIAILGVGMFFAWRWTGERDLLVFSWVMIPQALFLLVWNPTLPGPVRPSFQVGAVMYFGFLLLFMLALVELNWTVHRLRAPLLKRLGQAAAVVFNLSFSIPGLLTTPEAIGHWALQAGLPADLTFESLLVAVNVWAILVSRTNPLLVLALLANPVIALLNDAGIVPYGVMVGPFFEHTLALSDFLIDMAAFILLSHGAWKAWRARDELRVEFEAAREVQEHLVAPAVDVPGFKIESVYAPAKQVGGDFFRVLPDDAGSVLVVVGDVSGKGLRAAMTVSTIMGALRGCTSHGPAEILAYLNRVLLGQVSGFVTCCVARIAADGNMTVANAGNPSPYRNGEEMAIEPGLPLGMLAGATYEETIYRVAPGDRLTFVSDGVVEATNPQGELYGFERTLAVSNQPAHAIAEAARQFGQEDDITVLSVIRTVSLNPAPA
jgi:hypothetical protein